MVKPLSEKLSTELRRIFLKFLILKIIDDSPTHGYDLIKEIERRSNGRWTPSCGSIYPALESLEAKGWIVCEETDRRKSYTITPEGREALAMVKDRVRQQMEDANIFLQLILEDQIAVPVQTDRKKETKT